MKAQADAFQCWQATLAERKAFTAAAAKAMQYFVNRTAASAFLAWRDFADEQAALKTRLTGYIQAGTWLSLCTVANCHAFQHEQPVQCSAKDACRADM